MPFAISAQFRLGYYQGRDRHGAPERYPSPARLHAALVGAAHGRLAIPDLDDASLRALRWLEATPPDAIRLPHAVLNGGAERSYRDKGLITKGRAAGTLTAKKDSEPASRISALSGPILWWWAEAPDDVIETLRDITAEVAYLGEVSSPVRLTVEAVAERPIDAHEPLDKRRWGDESPTFEVATPGRYDHLQTAFQTLQGVRVPPESSDNVSSSEKERPDDAVVAGTRSITYAPRPPAIPATPWPWGIRVRVRTKSGGLWAPTPDDYVRWAVVFHRALVRQLGDNAPALVTGRCRSATGERATRPANRLAIQIVPPRTDEAGEGASFVLMIPRAADPLDVTQLREALLRVLTLFRRRGEELIVQQPGSIEDIELAHFWPAPLPGMHRWWAPTPVMIAEGGPSRRQPGRRWTTDDAILLAAAFVWRDSIDIVRSRGGTRYAALVDAVTARGVRVAASVRDTTKNPPDFAHKVPEGQPITCIQGLVSLGTLAGPTPLVAIGQSRHLGGGLLMPVDLPATSLDEDGFPTWLS